MRPNAKLLNEFLDYDSEDGHLRWKPRTREHFKTVNQFKNWNGRYPGTVAGRIDRKGYRNVAILGRLFKAHRVVWAMQNGQWPTGQIDHINGKRDDNRLCNLRDVSSFTNARNLKRDGWSGTGRIGVTKYNHHKNPKYVARIRLLGKTRHLGYFESFDEAVRAREQAEQKYDFQTH